MRHAARKRPAGTSHAYVNKLRCDSAGLKKRELAAHGPEPGQGRGGWISLRLREINNAQYLTAKPANHCTGISLL